MRALAVPGGTAPGDTAPAGTVPGGTVAGTTVPGRTVPGQAGPDRPVAAPHPGASPREPVSAPPLLGPTPTPTLSPIPTLSPTPTLSPSLNPTPEPVSQPEPRRELETSRRAAPHRHPMLAVLIVVLFLVAGGEGLLLDDLNNRLGAANDRIAADAASAAKSDSALQDRIKSLEQAAAGSLNSAAVATAVLPSVFRIDAGTVTGTAFALGRAPSGGGTDLVTNYHVIQALYQRGTRSATLERDGKRLSVKIIKVDQRNDLALLSSTQTIQRLSVNASPVVSGAPILVAGAPLGLAQSVTTGVVSAVRDDFPGEGGKTFIQFDAPINPGNSGGPVVNAQDQVVGIASDKADNAEGIGLAIPITVACRSLAIC